ncbi:MAG: TetR/AcrR family transcriptional regulator [Deltaproteobacteria bacterium]|nr:TetR/AcrR family transcriptional regulator [Deltaproteobacteria bacterium]
MLREHRRQQILESAKKVFAAKGYHATGVADIIKDCGIARGTFYLYFGSKRNVFETILDAFLELLKERIPRIDETVGIEGIKKQIHDNVTGVLSAYAENPDMARILLNEAVGLDKEFDRKLWDFYKDFLGLIEDALVLGQEMGIVRPLDTRIIAASIHGSMQEVVRRVLHGRFDMDLDQVVEEILAYNIRALFVPELVEAWDRL